MSTAAPSTGQGALADLGVELVKLAATLDSVTGEAEDLRLRCDQLLSDYVAKAQRAGVPLDLVESAKYAWVALIDERVLSSNLALRESWLANPLQMKHFDSFSAGEDFYTRLETYRHGADPRRLDVVEVYHVCLALGFAGKLGSDGRGQERRRLLMDQLANEIAGARGVDPAQLATAWAPRGQPAPAVDPKRWRGMPVWVVPFAAAAAVALVWLALSAWVGISVDGFTRDFPVR